MSETDNGAPAGFDPNTVPLDELQKMILSAPDPGPEPMEAPEPEPGPEPEPEPVAEPEPEPETAPTKREEPKEEPEPTEIELLQAKIDLVESQIKASEAVFGKQGGELSYLRQQNQALQDRLAKAEGEPPADDDNGEVADEDRPAPSRKAAKRIPDPTTTWSVGQAISQASIAFREAYPDAYVTDDGGQTRMAPHVEAELRRVNSDLERIFHADDPVYAHEETKKVLELTYLRADRAKKAERFKALMERKTLAKAKQTERKRAAASAGSSPGEAPRPKPLDPTKIPLKELQERILTGRFTR